ncbi:hypothetical protein Ancab_027707 [Ancistrocladus abbreviatus]
MDGGSGWDDYKPSMAMVAMQFSSTAMTLLNRAALVQGMSPKVFILYRQAIATLVLGPVAFFSREKSSGSSMGIKAFLLVFITSLIGVILNQSLYFEGLFLAPSTIASATTNLVPAVTFIMASTFGLEKVNIKRLSSNAKILGTVVCVGGAVSMALLKGPQLLNAQLPIPPVANCLALHLGGENWLLGCLFLFASSCCWSLWLILQVPLSAFYPDHLSLSAWMCFASTLQAGGIALFLEQDPEAWNLSSPLELTSCFFSGIVGSGIQFFVQSWCISCRGPLYVAMFNPLSTVMVAVLASIFLHEEIYTGSLLGAAAVIVGLYVVLWGKAREFGEKLDLGQEYKQTRTVQDMIDDSDEKRSHKIDLKQPLLEDKVTILTG